MLYIWTHFQCYLIVDTVTVWNISQESNHFVYVISGRGLHFPVYCQFVCTVLACVSLLAVLACWLQQSNMSREVFVYISMKERVLSYQPHPSVVLNLWVRKTPPHIVTLRYAIFTVWLFWGVQAWKGWEPLRKYNILCYSFVQHKQQNRRATRGMWWRNVGCHIGIISITLHVNT